MHPFFLVEVRKKKKKKGISWTDLLFQAKLKMKSIEILLFPQYHVVFPEWHFRNRALLGACSCTAKFMPLSAVEIHCWGSQDLWLQAGGTQKLLQSCWFWESSHAAPSLPATIPGHQTPAQTVPRAKGLGGSLPPGPSLGPPSIAYLERACQQGFSKLLNLPLTPPPLHSPADVCQIVLLLLQKLTPKITFPDMPKHSSWGFVGF